MDTNTFHAILHAQIDPRLGERPYAKNHEHSLLLLVSRLHSVYVSLLFICINLFHKYVSSSQE